MLMNKTRNYKTSFHDYISCDSIWILQGERLKGKYPPHQIKKKTKLNEGNEKDFIRASVGLIETF